MRNSEEMNDDYEMLDEYDFSNGIRGKYAKAYKEGVNIIKLDQDVKKFFPDSKSVNEALRTMIKVLLKEDQTLSHNPS
jgi:hypothetical protein